MYPQSLAPMPQDGVDCAWKPGAGWSGIALRQSHHGESPISCTPDALQAVGTSKADTHDGTGAQEVHMSTQQISGVLLLLVGMVALSASLGTAWVLSRSSRAGRIESAWFITLVSVVLFLLGVALCWFGVSALVEG
jgi:hypothetical protein